MIKLNKALSLLLMILFVVGLSACGGDSQSAEPTTAAQPTAVTDNQQPEATLPPPAILTPAGEPTLAQPQAPATATSPPDPTAVPGPIYPWPADAFGYGIQSHALVGDPAYAMDVIRNQLGLNWVKVQLEWALVEKQADIYDGVVAEANAKGLNLMLSVVGAPADTRARGNEHGPPDNYDLFGDFLTGLIERYPGQIHAIEVWNEQNLDREWDTEAGISPENYVDLLSVAHTAIKAADPNIIVISGALAPTGPGDWIRWADDFEYMDRALAAGMLQYADCVGAHHNGYNIPPDVPAEEAPNLAEAETAFFRGPFDDPFHLWSFKTTIDTYASKVQSVNPNMKLCVTEFGWASSVTYDAYPENFGFALDNTLEEQAQYIVQAFQQMHDSGNVWLAFLFNFDFGNKGNGPTDDPVPYSIVDLNGAPRPAFGAVAEMEKIP